MAEQFVKEKLPNLLVWHVSYKAEKFYITETLCSSWSRSTSTSDSVRMSDSRLLSMLADKARLKQRKRIRTLKNSIVICN
jgi:hypothetical protein